MWCYIVYKLPQGATEPCRLPKSEGAAWGVEILRFQEVQIIILAIS